MKKKVITIGVYGFTEELFFQALKDACVDVICDVRWRRGVRGSKYIFANSKRLQKRLDNMGVSYIHRRDLAPNPSIRVVQTQADKHAKVAKRERKTLSKAFIAAYQREILEDFDSDVFLKSFPENTNVVALFCVEKEAEGCHRWLLAEKLRQLSRVEIEHISPE